MRDQIDTIPVQEAYESADECPFCYMERRVEQRAIRYTVGPGASYMEPDVRGATDAQGFCREHYKKMYDYGNSLGNALIMQTYLIGLRKELDVQLENYEPVKKSLFSKKPEGDMPILEWLRRKNSSCFLCNKINYNMDRYYVTFFHLIKDATFREKVKRSKGLCMHHLEKLLESSQDHLPNGQIVWFRDMLEHSMSTNMSRIQEDLDWFVEKFDYRNSTADWKNSKDAVPRTMQKLQGGHPADRPYRQD